MASWALKPEHVPHWGVLPPSAWTAKTHPQTAEIARDVNNFFLEHWPFPSDKARQKFLRSDFSLATSYNCSNAKGDRLPYACKLITTVFLIDDILEYMSLEEGTAYNERLFPICCGEVLPNRSDPVEWILYDLFEEMRAKDKVLADECLEPTFEFMRSQTEQTRKHVDRLAPYLDYRYRDIGQTIISGLMKFCMELHFTPEAHEMMLPLEKNSGKHLAVVNDIFSWEKEMKAYKELHEEGALIRSSMKIMMDETGVGVEGTKRLLWVMAREFETVQEDLRRKVLADHPDCSDDIRRYMIELQYLMSGNEEWSKRTVRYRQLD